VGIQTPDRSVSSPSAFHSKGPCGVEDDCVLKHSPVPSSMPPSDSIDLQHFVELPALDRNARLEPSSTAGRVQAGVWLPEADANAFPARPRDAAPTSPWKKPHSATESKNV
jgi:hypothetical protein